MAKQKEYLETFQEEQENQYMPWKYTTSGKPTPFEEGKGNKKILAVMYFIGSAVCLVGAPFVSFFSCLTSVKSTRYHEGSPVITVRYNFDFDLMTFLLPLICILPFAILFFFVGRNHWKKHKQSLEARKQQAQNALRKKRKHKSTQRSQ